MANPTVTLALPVYNGENYVRTAVLSALAQTFGDFELIISDNGSSDATESVCRDLAALDSRIRYIRRSMNIGAGPNFNSIVSLATGEYFKWMAHDDVIAPTFVARCVEVLRADPSAVLACPWVRFMDARGEFLEDYASTFQTGSADRLTRFAAMFRGHRCFEIFGVIRLRDLLRTHLIGNYNHGDGVLLTHLSLMGRFAEVQEPLLYSRRHEEQSMFRFGITSGTGVDLEGYARWFDPRNGDVPRSFNQMLADYLWMVRVTPMPLEDRVRCHRIIFRWARVSWRILAGEWKRTLYHACRLRNGSRRDGIVCDR